VTDTPLSNAKSIVDTLRELLLDMARKEQYLPDKPPTLTQSEKARAIEVSQAALQAIGKHRDDKTLTSEHLHKAVTYAFLTGINDTYAHYNREPRSPIKAADVFHPGAHMDHVPDHMAKLYKQLDMPAKIHNVGFKWVLDNTAKIEEAGMAGNDCLSFILYYTYLIGSGRAVRMLVAERGSGSN